MCLHVGCSFVSSHCGVSACAHVHTQVRTLQDALSNVNQTAKMVARKEVVKVEEKLKASELALEGARKEHAYQVEAARADVATVTAERDAVRQQLQALEQRRREENATASTQLAACLTALGTARAAARHGGYYFSAAPSVGADRDRSLVSRPTTYR